MRKRKTLIITILVVGGLVCFGGIFLARGTDFPYSFSNLFDTDEIALEDLEDIYKADASELERLIGEISADKNLTQEFLDKLVDPQGEFLAGNLDEAQIEALTEEFVRGVDMDYSLKVSEADLNISSATSKEAVERYLVSAFFVIGRGFSQIKDIDQFVEEVTSEDVRLLDERIRDFEGICRGLKDLEVPVPALEVHKTGLEMFRGLTEFLKELKFLDKDPLRVLLSASKVKFINQKAEELAIQLQQLVEEYSINLP